MSISGHKTLNDMIERAREREIKMELRTKRKSEQIQTTVGQTKKPKTSDFHTWGQQGRGRCGKYGKPHGEACRVVGSGYYRCG